MTCPFPPFRQIIRIWELREESHVMRMCVGDAVPHAAKDRKRSRPRQGRSDCIITARSNSQTDAVDTTDLMRYHMMVGLFDFPGPVPPLLRLRKPTR